MARGGRRLMFLVHPFLLRIPYDHDGPAHYRMQLFVDSGDFNKYPLIPWFALATVGSVMAHFWFEVWTDPRRRARNTVIIGLVLIAVAWVRAFRARASATSFAWDTFFSYSFFLVQKYPPSLAHQFWFSGAVIFMVGVFDFIEQRSPILRPLAKVGRVPLFFYMVHIPLLAIFARRLGFYYHEGGVAESLIGWVVLLVGDGAAGPVVRWGEKEVSGLAHQDDLTLLAGFCLPALFKMVYNDPS